MFAESAELPGAALAPAVVAELAPPGRLVVGDGALRYRALFEAAGLVVPADDDARHVPAARLLAAQAAADGLGMPLEPRYLRRPDAEEVAR